MFFLSGAKVTSAHSLPIPVLLKCSQDLLYFDSQEVW